MRGREPHHLREALPGSVSAHSVLCNRSNFDGSKSSETLKLKDTCDPTTVTGF